MASGRDEMVTLKVMDKNQLIKKLVNIINNNSYQFTDLVISTPISDTNTASDSVSYSGKVVVKIEGRFEI